MARMSEYSVRISTLLCSSGEPSASVPGPIYNWRVSTAQPSSAGARGCGRSEERRVGKEC